MKDNHSKRIFQSTFVHLTYEIFNKILKNLSSELVCPRWGALDSEFWKSRAPEDGRGLGGSPIFLGSNPDRREKGKGWKLKSFLRNTRPLPQRLFQPLCISSIIIVVENSQKNFPLQMVYLTLGKQIVALSQCHLSELVPITPRIMRKSPTHWENCHS